MKKMTVKTRKFQRRRGAAFAAALALAAASLGGCAAGKTETAAPAVQTTAAQSEPQSAALPNPMQEVPDTLSFEELGIHMIVPGEAKDVQYFIISGEVADVRFTLDGVDYTWRASNTAEDFAGIFERFKEGEEIDTSYDADGESAKITIKTTESGGRLAAWAWGDTNYTLYTAASVEDEAIEALTLHLAELSLNEKQ